MSNADIGRRTHAPSRQAEERLPGDPLILLFVIGDMIVFTLFFCTYGYFRGSHLDLFRASQSYLHVNWGAINSLLLLSSSWLVVMSLKLARAGRGLPASGFIGGATLCGLLFSLNKVLEYRGELAAGHDFSSNSFFTFYYMLTGLHFAHLLCGIGILAYFMVVFVRRNPNASDVDNLESSAVYWHMVDLLWIVIFALLYLLP